jgi:ubiquinone/menaquinone biosynthesis C-methylase UbiE
MKRYRANAEYYDAECAHHAMLEQDVPFFLGHLPKRRQSVLELAVGTGRAAIPIAQAGHRVVGIDYAKEMLALAEQKRDAVGLGKRQLSLVHGDLLSFDLNSSFDWVCLFFNTLLSFTTLEELDAVLQNARRHLKPRGKFWLDVFQPNLQLIAEPTSANLDPCTFYVPALDRRIMKTTTVKRDAARQVQRVTYHYTWFGPSGVEHRQRTEFAMTFMFPRELQLVLERNGLEIEHFYGNYNGSALNADSPRMIVCCRKQQS